MTEGFVQYFDRPGPINTSRVIELCKRRIKALGTSYVVVASLTGKSAIKVAEALKKISVKVVAVRYLPCGMWRKDEAGSAFDAIPELKQIKLEWIRKGLERVPIDYAEEDTSELNKLGVKIVVCTPALWNIDRSFIERYGGLSVQEVINDTLRLYCPGMRVCVEIAIMAADSGAIPVDEEVIVMAGTERGLDTAVVMKPSYSVKMFDLYEGIEIREIICKPRTMADSKGRFIGRYTIFEK